MKEILERISGYFPRFIAEFMKLVSGPKRFLGQLKLDSPDTVIRALTFFISCLAVAFLLRLPFISGSKELWSFFTVLLVLLVVLAIAVFLGAAIVRISFLLVRGDGSFHDHLVVTLYMSGPLCIFFSFFAAASKGIVLVDASDLYPLFNEYMEYVALAKIGILDEKFERFLPLFESRPVLAATWLYWSAYVFSSIWQLLCWGGYRLINRVSQLRSFFAGIVAIFLMLPVYYIVVFAGRGLSIKWF